MTSTYKFDKEAIRDFILELRSEGLSNQEIVGWFEREHEIYQAVRAGDDMDEIARVFGLHTAKIEFDKNAVSKITVTSPLGESFTIP